MLLERELLTCPQIKFDNKQREGMLNLPPAQAETRIYLFREKNSPVRHPAEVALTRDAPNFGLVGFPGGEEFLGQVVEDHSEKRDSFRLKIAEGQL